jgi:integrase
LNTFTESLANGPVAKNAIVNSGKKKRKANRNANGQGTLFLRGKAWYWKIRWNGERMVYPTGTRIKSDAVIWKDNKLAELRNGGVPIQKAKSSSVLVGELLDDYIAYLKLKGRKSAKITAGVINSRLRGFFGKIDGSKLQTADLDRYRRQFADDPHKQATANRHLAYLHAAMTHGWKKQKPRKIQPDDIPFFEMADESCNIRGGFIEEDGYQKVLKELSASLKTLFICAYHVSTRKGELKDIRWNQVDFDDGVIWLERPDTKNKEGRGLPIYGDMKQALKTQFALRNEQYPEAEYVFFWHKEDVTIGHGGNRVVPGCHIKKFDASWKAAVERAKYPDLLFHDLRRSATRNMRKAGIDQAVRMKISGHKTDSMERRYDIMDATDILEAGKKAEAFSKKERKKYAAAKSSLRP